MKDSFIYKFSNFFGTTPKSSRDLYEPILAMATKKKLLLYRFDKLRFLEPEKIDMPSDISSMIWIEGSLIVRLKDGKTMHFPKNEGQKKWENSIHCIPLSLPRETRLSVSEFDPNSFVFVVKREHGLVASSASALLSLGSSSSAASGISGQIYGRKHDLDLIKVFEKSCLFDSVPTHVFFRFPFIICLTGDDFLMVPIYTMQKSDSLKIGQTYFAVGLLEREGTIDDQIILFSERSPYITALNIPKPKRYFMALKSVSRFSEALKLLNFSTDLFDSSEAINEEQRLYIEQILFWAQLRSDKLKVRVEERERREYQDVFQKITVPPENLLIAVFPVLLPKGFLVRPNQINFEAAVDFLVYLGPYLQRYRNVKQQSYPSGILLGDWDSIGRDQIAIVIDTLLAWSFAKTSFDDLRNLMLDSNNCHREKLLKELVADKRSCAWVNFSKGFYEQAIVLVQNNLEYLSDLLSCFGKNQINLIFNTIEKYIELFKNFPELVLNCFRRERKPSEELTPVDVMRFLELKFEKDPYILQQYALWLSDFKKDSDFDTHLINYTIRLIKRNDKNLQLYHQQLQQFLETKEYNVDSVLSDQAQLNDQERLAVFGKSNDYYNAINLLFDMGKRNEVEGFCKQRFKGHAQADALHYLIEKLLKVEGWNAINQKRILDILTNNFDVMDVGKVLEVLESVDLKELESFLRNVFLTLEFSQRNFRIAENLARAEENQVKKDLTKVKSSHVILDENSTCYNCGKKLKESFVHLPSGQLQHVLACKKNK